jgi:alpha-galactosidase
MNNHKYQLGLYRVFEVLTSRYPDVLWEGCASGGGRFDPAILQWFPQVWTSDNTDAVDRLPIQFGTSLVYPTSAMGAHISAVPSGNSLRTTSFTYRAHVAMMGGSFGLELDPAELDESDRSQIPGLIALAEKVNPVVVDGDFYRLSLPEESIYPGAMFVSQDGGKAVVFYFSTKATVNHGWPQLRLQGLDPKAKYMVDGDQVHSGAALMNIGVGYWFVGDYDSKVIFLDRQ